MVATRDRRLQTALALEREVPLPARAAAPAHGAVNAWTGATFAATLRS